MSKRIKKKYHYVINKIHFLEKAETSSLFEKLFSKKCLTIYLIAERAYTYKISGRCTSFRSQGNISNFVIRNFSYGVEQRIFVNNPRLDIYV